MAGFDKVVNTYEEAMAGLEDGMTVISGGFGICGIPENLIKEIKKMGTKELTIVSNNCGCDGLGLGMPSTLAGTKALENVLVRLADAPGYTGVQVKAEDWRERVTDIQTLLDAGAKVVAYDPKGIENAREIFENIEYADGPYEAANQADAVVIITEWNQFRVLDLGRLKDIMKNPVLVDLRNIYTREQVEKHGFRYSSIGRP